jgi:protein O-GlcNAc transferase
MDIEKEFQKACHLHKRGDAKIAEAIYTKILKFNKNFAPAYHNLGILNHERKQYKKALGFLEKAVRISNGRAEFVNSIAKHLAGTDNLDKLCELLSEEKVEAIELTFAKPFFEFLLKKWSFTDKNEKLEKLLKKRVTNRFDNGRFEEAVLEARYLLEKIPDSVFGWKSCAAALHELKNQDAAEFAARKSIELAPHDVQALNNLGNILRAQGKLEQALGQYRLATTVDPTSAISFAHMATALRELSRQAEALDMAKTAVELDPNYYQAWLVLGNIYYDNKGFRKAEKAFQRCVRLNKTYWRGHLNLGVIYRSLGYHEKAFEAYKKAHEIQPKNLEVLNNIGILFVDARRYADAIVIFKDALKDSPKSADLWLNMGSAYRELGHYTAALQCIDKAIEFRPNWAAAHNNKGIILMNTARHAEAEREFINAIEFDPGNHTIRSNLLFCSNYNPRLSLSEIFSRYKKYASTRPDSGVKDRIYTKKKKIRVGYLSPDFKKCSALPFILPMIRNHDREKFEIYCFGNIKIPDVETNKVIASCDQYFHTYDLSDQELEDLLIQSNIDIIVDLAGHTEGNRLSSLRNHPGRFQVSTLGFGYTTGLPYIDFFMAYGDILPIESKAFYSEKFLRLSEHLPYEVPLEIGEVNQLPALSNSFITFGCLSRGIRINENVLAAWAKILKSVPGSRMIINSKDFAHESECIRMKEKFLSLGIEEYRLDVSFSTPPWKLYEQIDIYLDCFPHNSGTTLFESLMKGVPFVTLKGKLSINRIGFSLLKNIDLANLSADSVEEYIEIAVNISNDLNFLNDLRSSLRNRLKNTGILDHKKSIRSIEAAYESIWH